MRLNNTLIFTVIMILSSMGAYAQKTVSKGVLFENDLPAAFNKIKKSKDKADLVFINFYKPDCSYCSKMNNLVFPTKQAGDFMNSHFSSVKIDVSEEVGKDLAKQYKITAFPTFLILNEQKEEVGRFLGFSEPDDFIEKVKYTMDQKNSVATKKQAYNEQKNTKAAMAYLEALYQAGMIKEMVNFLESIYYIFMPEERYSIELWKYVRPALANPNSRILSVILSEKYLVNQLIGKSIVDEAIVGSLRQYALLYVSGKLEKSTISPFSLLAFLPILDDQDAASHYIYLTCRLYGQKDLNAKEAYESIANYITPKKICELKESDRRFLETLFLNIEGMPQHLKDNYYKEKQIYFKQQLDKEI